MKSKIFKKLETLASVHKEIEFYEPRDLKTILKGLGRIPGSLNKELLEVLKLTNGASIIDYCFLGIKNNKLGTNLDQFYLELWQENNDIAGKVIGFMVDSLGNTYGYLINDRFDNKPIVYIPGVENDDKYVISSCLEKFLERFFIEIEGTLNGKMDLKLHIDNEQWPLDIATWKNIDPDLQSIFDELHLNDSGLINF